MTFLKENSNFFNGLTYGSFLCDYILSDINLIDFLSKSLNDKNLFRMRTNFLKKPEQKISPVSDVFPKYWHTVFKPSWQLFIFSFQLISLPK